MKLLFGFNFTIPQVQIYFTFIIPLITRKKNERQPSSAAEIICDTDNLIKNWKENDVHVTNIWFGVSEILFKPYWQDYDVGTEDKNVGTQLLIPNSYSRFPG